MPWSGGLGWRNLCKSGELGWRNLCRSGEFSCTSLCSSMSVDQSSNQSNSQSIRQSINRSTNQSINPSITQSVKWRRKRQHSREVESGRTWVRESRPAVGFSFKWGSGQMSNLWVKRMLIFKANVALVVLRIQGCLQSKRSLYCWQDEN